MNDSHFLISTGCLEIGQSIFNNWLSRAVSLACKQRGERFPRHSCLPWEKQMRVRSKKNSIIFVTVPEETNNISADYLNTCKLAFLEHMAEVSSVHRLLKPC